MSAMMHTSGNILRILPLKNLLHLSLPSSWRKGKGVRCLCLMPMQSPVTMLQTSVAFGSLPLCHGMRQAKRCARCSPKTPMTKCSHHITWLGTSSQICLLPHHSKHAPDQLLLQLQLKKRSNLSKAQNSSYKRIVCVQQ
jgi:hypothetical protein